MRVKTVAHDECEKPSTNFLNIVYNEIEMREFAYRPSLLSQWLKASS